jgi:hypothetical protein
MAKRKSAQEKAPVSQPEPQQPEVEVAAPVAQEPEPEVQAPREVKQPAEPKPEVKLPPAADEMVSIPKKVVASLIYNVTQGGNISGANAYGRRSAIIRLLFGITDTSEIEKVYGEYRELYYKSQGGQP